MSKSLKEQIACVKREVAMRKAVYPKRVTSGKMKAEEAEHETDTMQAVLHTLIKVSDPSLQDVGTAAEAPATSLYQQFVAEYDAFCRQTIGVGAKMDGAQGKALKAIIEYLKKESKTKDDAGALRSWQFIFQHWERVGDFIGKQKSLIQINKNLIEILEKIRNGADKKSAKTNKLDQLSIDLETERRSRSGAPNQWS